VFLDRLLSVIPYLRERFARDAEVDAAYLKHFQDVEIPSAPFPTTSETKLIADAVNKYDRREDVGKERHRIPGTVNEPVSYHQQFQGDQGAIGEADAVIDAAPDRVFAYLRCLDTNERINAHIKKNGAKLLRKVVHIPDSRSMLYTNVVPLSLGLADRVFSTWFAWEEDESGGFAWAFAAAERCSDKVHVDAMEALISGNARASGAIRGTSSGLFKIIRLADNVCRVKYTVQVHLGGKCLARAANSTNTIVALLFPLRSIEMRPLTPISLILSTPLHSTLSTSPPHSLRLNPKDVAEHPDQVAACLGEGSPGEIPKERETCGQRNSCCLTDATSVRRVVP
jgi:hypothetical protein